MPMSQTTSNPLYTSGFWYETLKCVMLFIVYASYQCPQSESHSTFAHLKLEELPKYNTSNLATICWIPLAKLYWGEPERAPH